MRAADTSNLALKLIKAADLNITIWRLAYLKTENKTQYIADMQVKCILRNFEAIFHLLLTICLLSSLVCNFSSSTKKESIRTTIAVSISVIFLILISSLSQFFRLEHHYKKRMALLKSPDSVCVPSRNL